MAVTPPEPDLRDLVGEEYCYLTTTGRVSGRPHEIEIWYALVPETSTLYMLSGGQDRSDWVRNLRRDPMVSVRISDRTLAGRARAVVGAREDTLARRLLVEKYERAPGRLSNWGRTALPIAVDLGPESAAPLP